MKRTLSRDVSVRDARALFVHISSEKTGIVSRRLSAELAGAVAIKPSSAGPDPVFAQERFEVTRRQLPPLWKNRPGKPIDLPATMESCPSAHQSRNSPTHTASPSML